MYINSKTEFTDYKKYISKISLSTLNLIHCLKKNKRNGDPPHYSCLGNPMDQGA